MSMTKENKAQPTEEEKEQVPYDVTLHGSEDGPAVPANKALLAARSPVFESMFFGNYQERDGKVVSLDYPALVLKVLVKYCLTDELDLDMLCLDDEGDDDYLLADEEAILMVQLRDAANYLEMMDLHRVICKELAEFIAQKNALPAICAILNELFERRQASSEHSMWATLMIIVENQTSACFFSDTDKNKGILACQPALLCSLMTANFIDSLLAVKCLKLWCQAYPEIIMSSDQTFKEKLHKIANSLKLETIPSEELAQIEPCSLFSKHSLDQACAKQLDPKFTNLAVTDNIHYKLEPFFSTSLFAEGYMDQRSVEQLMKAFGNATLSDNSYSGTSSRSGVAHVRGCRGVDISGCNGTYETPSDSVYNSLGLLKKGRMYFKKGFFNGNPSEFFLLIDRKGCTLGVVPLLANFSYTVATGGIGSCPIIPQQLFMPSSIYFGEYLYGVIPYLWELESQGGKEPEPQVFIQKGLGLIVDIRKIPREAPASANTPARRFVKAKRPSPLQKRNNENKATP